MVGDQWEHFALLSAIRLPPSPPSVFIALAILARYNWRAFNVFLNLIPTGSARRRAFPQPNVNATGSYRLSLLTAPRTLLKEHMGSP